MTNLFSELQLRTLNWHHNQSSAPSFSFTLFDRELKVLFIINGKSKRLNAVQLEIEKTRSNYPDLQIHISVSKRSGDCFRIANSELNNFEAFIACGGDGTFNEVLNGLYFSKNPPPKYIGLLPAESANDFVKSIGRRSVDQMLQNLKNNHAKPMDIGLLSRAGRTRVFANAASNGLAVWYSVKWIQNEAPCLQD